MTLSALLYYLQPSAESTVYEMLPPFNETEEYRHAIQTHCFTLTVAMHNLHLRGEKGRQAFLRSPPSTGGSYTSSLRPLRPGQAVCGSSYVPSRRT
ncbi:hypothetical protein FA13DRAFT_1735354 [Coprinellus micaceus]|uniref:Uncharacterized protein n=1 Tax=Coprinellus micaceus TaxID=71717 RepID=A0A4Y7T4H2_COPMI|nr:hypothetical protein FA13DRAFT_1735354 [Coprinellus micaceus]